MFGLRRGMRMLSGLALDGGLVVRSRRGGALRRRSRWILCRRCGGGLVLCYRDHGNGEQEDRSQNNRHYLYRFHVSPLNFCSMLARGLTWEAPIQSVPLSCDFVVAAV